MKKVNGNAKLTAEQVKIITDIFIYTNKSDSEIGNFFGVSRECINSIRNGKRWAKVTGISVDRSSDITRRVVKKIPSWWREDTEKLIEAKIAELLKNDSNVDRDSKRTIIVEKKSNDFREFTND